MKRTLLFLTLTLATLCAWCRTLSPAQLTAFHNVRQILTYADGWNDCYTGAFDSIAPLAPAAARFASEYRTLGHQETEWADSLLDQMLVIEKEAENLPLEDRLLTLIFGINVKGGQFDVEQADECSARFFQLLDKSALDADTKAGYKALWMLISPTYEQVYLQEDITNIVNYAGDIVFNKNITSAELRFYLSGILVNQKYCYCSDAEKLQISRVFNDCSRSLAYHSLWEDNQKIFDVFKLLGTATDGVDHFFVFRTQNAIAKLQSPTVKTNLRGIILMNAVAAGEWAEAAEIWEEVWNGTLDEVSRTGWDTNHINTMIYGVNFYSFPELARRMRNKMSDPVSEMTAMLTGIDDKDVRRVLYFRTNAMLSANEMSADLAQHLELCFKLWFGNSSDPHFDGDMAINLSKAYQLLNRTTQAVEIFDLVDLDRYPKGFDTIYRAKVNISAGTALGNAGQLEEAVGHYESALEYYQQTGVAGQILPAASLLASCYVDLGRSEDGSRILDIYDRVRPDYPAPKWDYVYDFNIEKNRIALLPRKEWSKRITDLRQTAINHGAYYDAAELSFILSSFASEENNAVKSAGYLADAIYLYNTSGVAVDADILQAYENYLAAVYFNGSFDDYNNTLRGLIDWVKDSPARYSTGYINILSNSATQAMAMKEWEAMTYYFSEFHQAGILALAGVQNDRIGSVDLMTTIFNTYLKLFNGVLQEGGPDSAVLAPGTPFGDIKQQLDENLDILLDATEECFPKDNRRITQLNNAAFYLMNTGQHDRAEALIHKIEEQFPDFQTWELWARLYCDRGDTDKCIAIYERQFEQYVKPALSNKGQINITNVSNFIMPLTSMHCQTGNNNRAMELARWRFDMARTFVETNYTAMTSQQKASLTDNGSLSASDISYILPSVPTEANRRLAYDGALYFRNLLLESNNAFKNAILASGDSDIVGKYNELQALTQQNANLTRQSAEGAFLGDSLAAANANRLMRDLYSRIQTLELDLQQAVPAMTDMTARRKTTWREVQKKLRDNEAAIEFIINNDRLGALVLRHKGMKAPEFVPLLTVDQLHTYLGHKPKMVYHHTAASPALFNGLALYRDLWEPLEQYLHGVERIYYAPVGELSLTAFNALTNADGVPLCERYDMRLVSTTAQVITESKTKNTPVSSMTLYGDVYYNHEDPTSQASTWKYLPNSRAEVDNIASIMGGAGVPLTRHTQFDATEDTFRAMSGQSPDCLLLSTHGFYFDTEQAVGEKFYRNKGLVDPERAGQTVQRVPAMKRAGLALTDANYVWTDREQRPDPADGILLADELSELDLSDTRLAVMSACETARGEVSPTEGVTGLPRALKLAGVKSIVLTLWPVDDAKTRQFMSTFFRYLADGVERHEAFNRAQRELRATGRQNIDHWAPFIMLD